MLAARCYSRISSKTVKENVDTRDKDGRYKTVVLKLRSADHWCFSS